MSEAKFIGNCNDLIDWDSVIRDIEKATPDYIGPLHEVGDGETVPGVDEVVGQLRDAGYKKINEGGNAGWDMFFPGSSFDEAVAQKFMEFVGMDDYINCWVSRVLPGDVAPWHWDITDDPATLEAENNGNMRRFHCHIDKPKPGHIVIVDNMCLYNQNQGNVWQWPERKSWHAGANAGLEPKYLFNIWGN